MHDLFAKFEESAAFVERWLKEQFQSIPGELLSYMRVNVSVSEKRIALAVASYREQIARYAEYLDSKNPDHYKRCGALLFALCANPIIVEVKSEYTPDDIETGFSRVEHAASEQVKKMLEFYNEFHNQFAAFEICYRLCEVYEGRTKQLDFDAIHNICFYLKRNNLPIDAYFMLFKTLMM